LQIFQVDEASFLAVGDRFIDEVLEAFVLDSARASRSVSSVNGTSAWPTVFGDHYGASLGEVSDITAETSFDLANVLDLHEVTFLPPMNS
jgi:hypothetical protein